LRGFLYNKEQVAKRGFRKSKVNLLDGIVNFLVFVFISIAFEIKARVKEVRLGQKVTIKGKYQGKYKLIR